jgi:hypothetical protein
VESASHGTGWQELIGQAKHRINQLHLPNGLDGKMMLVSDTTYVRFLLIGQLKAVACMLLVQDRFSDALLQGHSQC